MGTQRDEDGRPAFYALRRGGWRDWVTLLHPPYTLWHLSYVAVGAALAPHFHLDRLLWALVAFFLAMGVAAHALDELNGRPLRTRSRRRARRARRRGARRRGRDRHRRRARLGLVAARVRRRRARCSCRPTTSSSGGAAQRLGLRARLGRVPGADGLLRRGADDPDRGASRPPRTPRAQPGAAHALDAVRARAARARARSRGSRRSNARCAC